MTEIYRIEDREVCDVCKEEQDLHCVLEIGVRRTGDGDRDELLRAPWRSEWRVGCRVLDFASLRRRNLLG